jgi:hypothetical protein
MTKDCIHDWWVGGDNKEFSVCTRCYMGLQYINDKWVFQEYITPKLLKIILMTEDLKEEVISLTKHFKNE